MASQLGAYLRELQQINGRLDGYLLGLKHGMLWADVHHFYKAQIKEIDNMLAALKEDDGKESAAEAHARA